MALLLSHNSGKASGWWSFQCSAITPNVVWDTQLYSSIGVRYPGQAFPPSVIYMVHDGNQSRFIFVTSSSDKLSTAFFLLLSARKALIRAFSSGSIAGGS